MKPHETLKMLEEGKKMKHPTKGGYFYMDTDGRLWMAAGDMAGDVSHMPLEDLNFFEDWEPYTEHVSFFEAMEAVKWGKKAAYHGASGDVEYIISNETNPSDIYFLTFGDLLHNGFWTIIE